MNVLRHNFVTIALTLVVAAVTAANSFTLTAYLRDFHMNNSDLVAQVAFNESNRCERLENSLQRLWKDHVAARQAANELSDQLSEAAHHIRDCHTLLEKAGIKPPAFPLEQCPPECEKCPLKIQAGKST